MGLDPNIDPYSGKPFSKPKENEKGPDPGDPCFVKAREKLLELEAEIKKLPPGSFQVTFVLDTAIALVCGVSKDVPSALDILNHMGETIKECGVR